MDKYMASLEEKVTLTKAQLKTIITMAYWCGNDTNVVGTQRHSDINKLFDDALNIIERLETK
jgi:hypothetical protein